MKEVVLMNSVIGAAAAHRDYTYSGASYNSRHLRELYMQICRLLDDWVHFRGIEHIYSVVTIDHYMFRSRHLAIITLENEIELINDLIEAAREYEYDRDDSSLEFLRDDIRDWIRFKGLHHRYTVGDTEIVPIK